MALPGITPVPVGMHDAPYFSARSAEVRNTRLAYTLVAALCLMLGVAHFAAAQSTAPPSGTNVALIDINKVFESHARFQDRFKSLGDRFKELETRVRKDQAELVKLKEALDGLNAGTPAYKAKEAELAKRDSEVRVSAGLEQKTLAEEEAKIYYETYKEVSEKCAEFAARKGIGLVLRLSNAEIKPEDPNSVRMGIGRLVVYQRGLDITNLIIAEINRNGGPTKGPGVKPKIDSGDSDTPAVSERPTRPTITPGTKSR